MSRRIVSIVPAVVLWAGALTVAPAAHAQSGGGYTMTSSAVASGGATFSTGGSYSLGGTIGQADASNPMTGGSYSLTGGFWPRIASLLKGDADGNGAIDVADVFYLINNLFAGGPPPANQCVGDANSSGTVDIADVFFLVNYLFASGPAPAPPDC
jgi:hypothetical protein